MMIMIDVTNLISRIKPLNFAEFSIRNFAQMVWVYKWRKIYVFTISIDYAA